jgi:hypothetical protein
MSLKQRISRLLEGADYEEIMSLYEKSNGIVRILISLAYDKDERTCWRAIEAIGLIAGKNCRSNTESTRVLAGRLLWTIREESGGIGWSAPEMLGEIVRNCPGPFSDIVPVIASFRDEDMLRPGVLRALFRIAGVRPDLVGFCESFVDDYLTDKNEYVRAYALMLCRVLNLSPPGIKKLSQDNSVIRIFLQGEFITVTVGKLLSETAIITHDRVDE